MKKDYSSKWKASKQPRKQRKYRFNAPTHIRRKFLSTHLSKELRTKHETRSIPIRKGDRIKVIKGQFKKKEGVVNRVDLSRIKVFVDGIERVKKDGSKSFYALEPSNLMIIELDKSDKKRLKRSEQKPTEKKTVKKIPGNSEKELQTPKKLEKPKKPETELQDTKSKIDNTEVKK